MECDVTRTHQRCRRVPPSVDILGWSRHVSSHTRHTSPSPWHCTSSRGADYSVRRAQSGSQFTTQFTCFTSTKVQTLTPEKVQVQYLVLIVSSSSHLHLITFQCRADGTVSEDVRGVVEDVGRLTLGFHTSSPKKIVLSLLTLLVKKSKNTDTSRHNIMGVVWLPKPDDLDFEVNPLLLLLIEKGKAK
jgi:hypothetical protein